MFTNLNLTDMETCYKVFRREVIQSIDLREDRFGFEPEVTAKLARGGWRIYEVGISYYGRTYDEGKKIGWADGCRAVYCIVRYSAPGLSRRSRAARVLLPRRGQRVLAPQLGGGPLVRSVAAATADESTVIDLTRSDSVAARPR